MKKIIPMILALAALMLTSCSPAVPKTFVKPDFSIVLDSGYEEREVMNTYAYYVDRTTLIVCIRDEFETLQNGSDTTLDEYAAIVREANSLDSEPQTDSNGNLYFEYKMTAENAEFYYNAYLFKSSGGFFVISFASKGSGDNSQIHERFEKYTSSIVFK